MAGKSIQIPTLPSIGPSVDPEVRRSFDILKNFFAAVRANGGFGGSTTVQQTVIQQTGGGGSGGDSIINPPSPPAISGLTATGAFSSILLNWNDTGYSNYGYTQIWRSTTNDLGTALYVGESSSIVYCDTPPTASTSITYYYWARVVSYTGLTGPWSGTSGVSAHTATNPAYVLQSLAGQITASELASALGTKIAGIEAGATVGAPAGTMVAGLDSNVVARQGHGVFLDTFEVPIDPYYSSMWEGNVDYPLNGKAGGKVLRATGEEWSICNTKIPFDPTKLYRFKARYRKTAGNPGRLMYFGIQGVAADGVTLVNSGGLNDQSGQQYMYYAAPAVSIAWTEVLCFFKGWGGTAFAGSGTLADPYGLHPLTRYFQPLFIANWNSGVGCPDSIMEIDYIAIDIIPENLDLIADSPTRSISDLQTRINTAELDIDTVNGQLTATAVSLGDQINTVQLNLDGVSGQLTATAESLGDEISSVQLAMDGVHAEATIKVQNGNQIAGIGLIAGPRTSQFIVLADQFAVLLPNGTGTPKTPFVVGNIAGVASVGISGGLIVDGSITANSIAAQTISGDKLAAANLIAYSAQIADGIITNAKISALDAGKITTGYLSANRIQSGSIDGKITSITGGQIQTGTITADHIIADAVTDKDEKFVDYECDGGESNIDVLTSTPITLSPGAVILVIANASGSSTLYTMNLSRTYGAVTQKVASINTPFSLAYSDRVDTSISPEMTRFNKPTQVVIANYSIYGGSGSESSQGQGQSFVADAGGYTLGAVAFRFQKVGAPTDNLVVTVTDGLNSGNVVASGTYPMASFSGSKKTVTIPLQNPGALTGGQTYYVKLTRSGGYDSSNYVRIWGWNDSRSGSSGRFSCNSNTWNSPGTTDVKFSTFALVTGSENWTYTLNLAADNPEGSGYFLSTDALSAQLTVLQVKR